MAFTSAVFALALVTFGFSSTTHAHPHGGNGDYVNLPQDSPTNHGWSHGGGGGDVWITSRSGGAKVTANRWTKLLVAISLCVVLVVVGGRYYSMFVRNTRLRIGCIFSFLRHRYPGLKARTAGSAHVRQTTEYSRDISLSLVLLFCFELIFQQADRNVTRTVSSLRIHANRRCAVCSRII